MGLVSNGCKLSNGSCFEQALICKNIDGCHPTHGCDMEGETDEAAVGSSVSTASSIDLEDLVGDSSDVVEAVKMLLHGLGEDIHRAGLLKTPLRVARAFAFATKGYRQNAKDLVGDALFPEGGLEAGSGFAGGLGGMVIVRNIHQYSLCSSCLVPFKVCCHIAYISSGYRVVGLSKLARITDMFSRRLQNPQNLADQICKGLSDAIQPKGVAVILQSWHLPLSYCGHVGHSLDSAFQHAIITYSGRGQFEDKGNSAWDYLLALLRLEGVSIPRTGNAECNFVREEWCPCVNLHVGTAKEGCITSGLQKDYGNFESINGNIYRSTSNGESPASKMLEYSVLTLGESFSLMVSAVEIILESLVTGMVKEDLHQTAIYYTKWLLQFRRGHEESLYKLSMKMENVMEWQVPRDNVIMDTLRNGLSIVNMVSNGSRLLKPNEGALGGVLAQLDVPFCSLCEHHLLPFFGKGHIGYLASDAGSQDVSRDTVMEMIGALGHKLQVQERLTKQIAEAIAYRFSLSSIIVVLEASHVCMLSRGVEKLGSSTATDAVLGCFATDYTVKAHFLEMVMRNREVKRATSVL